MVNRNVVTLDEFTLREMKAFPKATGELAGLLKDIGLAAKRINVEVNKAGLVDILGNTGEINILGEEVKKMDHYANEQLTGVLQHGISCAGIASEELDDWVAFDNPVSRNARYIIGL
jgi:fructose-1,6-bisphosphatase I